MLLPSFDYHAPGSLSEALKIKSQLGTSAPVLAGGTDLIVNLKQRPASPAAVISLRNIKEMTGIEVKPDSVVIKAGTSLAQTAEDEAVRKHFPILVKAIESIGATGIQRFRGTIGGNLCLQPRCILYNQSLFWRTGKDKCHRTEARIPWPWRIPSLAMRCVRPIRFPRLSPCRRSLPLRAGEGRNPFR
jgi:4-hydroxybenzoyl-CoA reductase subunit beta